MTSATAIVRLGEAGATLPQIVRISGHEIYYCARILETYLPRTFKMAQEAVRLLDAEERRLDSLGAQTDEDMIADLVASGLLDDNPPDDEADEDPKRARRSAGRNKPSQGEGLGAPRRRRQAARARQPPGKPLGKFRLERFELVRRSLGDASRQTQIDVELTTRTGITRCSGKAGPTPARVARTDFCPSVLEGV